MASPIEPHLPDHPPALQSSESQLSLFTATEQWQTNGRQAIDLVPSMSSEALLLWKQRVADFQRQTRFQAPETQGSLFGLPLGTLAEAPGSYGLDPSDRSEPSDSSRLALSTPDPTPSPTISDRLWQSLATDPIDLNPFALPQQNINFWQYPTHESGGAALYFVIDYEASLVLYIGETLRSHKRWKGAHDCKRYLSHYRQVHYEHHQPTRLGIGFWGEAPVETKARQRLERSLIERWRSPFNKENWTLWGTPFVS